ncbi:hypothetical protein N7478_001436 [Penicillium angulare]|uniref:uncharacterized protein n=1 Tax=Penicillium angulare TaxID=116970 RepID=UPI002541D734|nr:uncharacterized protein N7478_001436 [Penicillium angulare]KAJ5292185.1 hypothetical protein N7478_001436 [Penicillium angulare]
MVLELLTAIAACPAIVGTTEAVRQSQRTNAKEKHRGVKSNLIVSCAGPQARLYIGLPTVEGRPNLSQHPFAGYFLPYPERNWARKGEGMVSTICDKPPQLNWIYVDEETYEVKYGLRTDSEEILLGRGTAVLRIMGLYVTPTILYKMQLNPTV